MCMCMCLTRGEKVLMDTQPPSRPPPQLLHLLSLFELLHLLQCRAILLYALHVVTASFKESQKLIIHQVAVLHI